VDAAIKKARADPRPSLIVARTHIGFGMPKKQDTSKAHGEPPGDEELNGAKAKLGWPLEPRFLIPEEVHAHLRQAVARGAQLESEWTSLLAGYRAAFPDLAAEFARRTSAALAPGWEAALPVAAPDAKGVATRVSSGAVINALAPVLPELLGGSADLTPSNNTWIKSSVAIQSEAREGRNIHFGVREHAMGSITNGMALHGGLIPFAATFLIFSDYMRPAIRLSALSHAGSIWVFTHDSIGLGEDGPTHQPVEHLAALRAIPNLVVLRPMDANEVSEAWRVAISRRSAPTALALTRQALPVVDRTRYAAAAGLAKGAYVLADVGQGAPRVILMASGSEVPLILEAAAKLAEAGVASRVVSFPSWELFAAQDKAYRDSVLPPSIKARVAVEAGVAQGWERWVGDEGETICMTHYGASAPAKLLFEKFGFTAANVVAAATRVLK
jgi:transketolase